MKRYTVFAVLIAVVYWYPSGFALEEMPTWTWLHRKCFSEEDLKNNKEKKEIICSKVNLPPFSQLIFSWNAIRPKKGSFIFWVQARHGKNKVWGKWHKMMEWGSSVQASYKSYDIHSQYHHVRLEMNQAAFADAFCIKVTTCGDANLSQLHAFTVTLSDLPQFSSEVHDKSMAGLPSIHIRGAPTISQFELPHERSDGMCSPTSCTMLTRYLTGKRINPLTFAESSFDTGLDKYGSWPFNMAHAYECADGKVLFCVTRCGSFKNLHAYLMCDIPVVVSVRGVLQGAPREYTNGHLLMVVGYDAINKHVICHDPAASNMQEVKKRYDLPSFLRAWERSHRLSYVAEKVKEEKGIL